MKVNELMHSTQERVKVFPRGVKSLDNEVCLCDKSSGDYDESYTSKSYETLKKSRDSMGLSTFPPDVCSANDVLDRDVWTFCIGGDNKGTFIAVFIE